MAETNFKPLIGIKMKEFQDTFPEYTYGQIIYSVQRVFRKNNPDRGDFFDMTDKEFYDNLSKSFSDEFTNNEDSFSEEEIRRFEEEANKNLI